jgi:hypothetical protein
MKEPKPSVPSADSFNRIAKTLEVSSCFLLNASIQDKAKIKLKMPNFYFSLKSRKTQRSKKIVSQRIFRCLYPKI